MGLRIVRFGVSSALMQVRCLHHRILRARAWGEAGKRSITAALLDPCFYARHSLKGAACWCHECPAPPPEGQPNPPRWQTSWGPPPPRLCAAWSAVACVIDHHHHHQLHQLHPVLEAPRAIEESGSQSWLRPPGSIHAPADTAGTTLDCSLRGPRKVASACHCSPLWPVAISYLPEPGEGLEKLALHLTLSWEMRPTQPLPRRQCAHAGPGNLHPAFTLPHCCAMCCVFAS